LQAVLTLERYVPDPAPDVIAGILLHDAPEHVLDRAGLDRYLLCRFGVTAHRIVGSIEREHKHLAGWSGMTADLRAWLNELAHDEDAVLLAGSADKIVAFTSVLRRSDRAADARVYWHRRRLFVARLPYFREYHLAVADRLPAPMADELSRLIYAAGASASRAGFPAQTASQSRMVRDVIASGS
jgi:hypothetical protein